MKISLKSDMRFPGFKILDRYILRRFLQTYAFAIAMITVVLVVFDYAERVDDFTELKAPFSAIIFDYYLNFVPDFINQYSGLFTFIAVIFFTSKMAYQTEIIAMLSGGMSFMRLMWPYFLGALVITLLSLALNLWVIPVSQISCVEFEQKYFKSNQTVQYDRHIYRQIEPGEFVYVRGFNRGNRASYMALLRGHVDSRIARGVGRDGGSRDGPLARAAIYSAPHHARRRGDVRAAARSRYAHQPRRA